MAETLAGEDGFSVDLRESLGWITYTGFHAERNIYGISLSTGKFNISWICEWKCTTPGCHQKHTDSCFHNKAAPNRYVRLIDDFIIDIVYYQGACVGSLVVLTTSHYIISIYNHLLQAYSTLLSAYTDLILGALISFKPVVLIVLVDYINSWLNWSL